MAVTDAPQTLSELRTDFSNRVRIATGVTATANIVDRYLNIGNQDLHLHYQWWWSSRRAEIITKPPYSTGTVAINQGATALTGTSTAWTTADDFGNNNAAVGDKITIGAVGEVYLVNAVGSATSITLGSRYTGSDISSGGGYTVYQDEYALASDFFAPLDVRLFSEEYKIELIGPKEFYRKFVRNSVRQAPRYATLITLAPSGSAAVRRRVVFGPAPDKAYTIPYRYTTTSLAVSSGGTEQATMTATTDEPIVPMRYRQAIVLNALYHWYRDRKDDVRSQEVKAEYDAFILRITQDVTPVVEDRLRFVPAIQTLGVARRRHGRRYSTDSRFDQMLN